MSGRAAQEKKSVAGKGWPMGKIAGGGHRELTGVNGEERMCMQLNPTKNPYPTYMRNTCKPAG